MIYLLIYIASVFVITKLWWKIGVFDESEKENAGGIEEEIVVHKGKNKYISRKMRKSLKKYLKNQKKNQEGFWSKERKWWEL